MVDVDAASDQLRQVDVVRRVVRARAAKDHVVWRGWAIFVAVFLPPFDLVSGTLWGPVITLAAVAGTVATARYYGTRQREVRRRLPRPWAWVALGVWYVGLVVAAEIGHGSFSLAWTVAGVAAALPMAAYGAFLARTER